MRALRAGRRKFNDVGVLGHAGQLEAFLVYIPFCPFPDGHKHAPDHRGGVLPLKLLVRPLSGETPKGVVA